MAGDEDLVLTEVDADGVATFTLNRPERRNAWTAAMENRYFDLLAAADTDPAVRAGVGNALDLLLSSRVFEADEARELGLVNRVLEPGQVLPAARQYARDLARNCSPAAMAAIRHQVLADLDAPFEEACRRSYALMEVLNSGADFREGVDSFMRKRPPAFRPLADDFDPEKITGVRMPGARMTTTELLQR